MAWKGHKNAHFLISVYRGEGTNWIPIDLNANSSLYKIGDDNKIRAKFMLTSIFLFPLKILSLE